MASLYRPVVTQYRLDGGKGKAVRKGTPGAVKVSTRSPTWWGSYSVKQGGRRVRKYVRLSKSKNTARRMLAEIQRKADLESAGVIDRYQQHRERPIEEHVADYRDHLDAKGGTQEHIEKTIKRIERAIDATHALYLTHLDAHAISVWLATLATTPKSFVPLPDGVEWFRRDEFAAYCGVSLNTVARFTERHNLRAEGQGRARRWHRSAVERAREVQRGIGTTTINHYVTSLRAFSRWLCANHRTEYDVLSALPRRRVTEEPRICRRALSAADFARLLSATANAEPHRGISGTDRARLYLLAARTGFRASELASLTPASFDLERQTVTLSADRSKRRKREVQPIPTDVVDAIRPIVETTPKGQLLWADGWSRRAADLIRRDLAAAGIPFVDGDGARYDFHALRHQFVSDLVRAGVDPKTAQILARHSAITLTMDVYTHTDQEQIREAVERLK